MPTNRPLARLTTRVGKMVCVCLLLARPRFARVAVQSRHGHAA